MDAVAAWLSLNPDPADDPVRGMREAGLLAPAPDYATIARLKREIVARTGLPGLASVWGGRQLVFRHFLGFGSAAQRAEWAGRALAVAISEPGVGAHPKKLTTRAETVAGGFRITGRKAWVSNGPDADAIIVFAITSEADGRKRYTAFIVPRDVPGLTMEDMPGFHALRPSRHCLVTLDCEVPESAVLGEAGTAYERMAMPFRDVEDAVATFAVLGALRHGLAGVRGGDAMAEGEIAALLAVFGAAADAAVARLDAAVLRPGDAVVSGLRLMAIDLAARLRRLAPELAVLADLDAILSIAQGPRLARLQMLGESVAAEGG